MKITQLKIANFRGITELHIENLQDMVVIAGPNGCGKSTVLDAIRLLKSVYGGYQPDEARQWMAEFNIAVNRDAPELAQLLRDDGQILQIRAGFALSEEEVEYLATNAERVAWPLVWQNLGSQKRSPIPTYGQSLAADERQYGREAQQRTEAHASALRDELGVGEFEIAVTINGEGQLGIEPSMVAETVFRTYDPANVGVIDFHSAQRQYGREQVQGINLNLEEQRNRAGQNLLYNAQAKYKNIKTELAQSYVSGLIARDAGVELLPNNLEHTLIEMFELFFEGKSFAGVRPTDEGRPTFPVILDDGSTHDIDELSSGEKEILYGYLRLRNTRARNSIVLLDEPELHLNPRLVQGLPDFYHRHIGKQHGNQIWLITHSDALLRESVGRPSFSAFHMRHARTHASGNQAAVLDTRTDIDRAIVDLVGDLAGYRPGAPLLLLEGKEESGFDRSLIMRLFPEVAARVNIVSAGSKARVAAILDLLDKSSHAGAVLAGSVHAICDRDLVGVKPSGLQTWDVYHIENYLLWEPAIQAALEALLGTSPYQTETELADALTDAARAVLPALVEMLLREDVNRRLVSSIDLGSDPGRTDKAEALAEAIDRSLSRIDEARDELDVDGVRTLEKDYRSRLESALADGTWRSEFSGRDVLKRFASGLRPAVNYEVFRNVVIDKLHLEAHQPPGMVETLRSVLPAHVWET